MSSIKGWKRGVLSKFAKVNPESTSSKTDPEFEFSYISIEAVKSLGNIDYSNRLKYKDAPSRARRIIRKNDIILSTVRPYLKSFAINRRGDIDIVASTGFASIRSNEEVDPDFLYQTVCGDEFVTQLCNSMVGSNYPAVNNSDVEDCLLNCPPYEEQKRIAEILTSVDKVIELTEIEIEKLKNLKKGMMQDLLTKGIGHTKFKDSPIGKIPESWELASGTELMVKVTDGEHLSPVFTDVGVPMVSAKDVQDWGVDFSNTRYVSATAFETMKKRCNPERGDVLIVSRGATIGRSTENLSCKEFALMGSVILLKPCLTKVNGGYLAAFFQLPTVQDRLLNLSGSSAQQAIYLKDIKQLKIPVPPMEEQEEIAKIVKQLNMKLSLKKSKLDKLQMCKKGLMQDLLTGKVRVKV